MEKGEKVKLHKSALGCDDWFKESTITKVHKAKEGKEQLYDIQSEYGSMTKVPETELKPIKPKEN